MNLDRLDAFNLGVSSARAAVLIALGFASFEELEAHLAKLKVQEERHARDHQGHLDVLDQLRLDFEEVRASYEDRIHQLEAALAERAAPTATPPTEGTVGTIDLSPVEEVRKRAGKLIRELRRTPWNKLHDKSGGEWAAGYRWRAKLDIILVPIDRRRQYVLILRERTRGGATVVVSCCKTADLGTLKPETIPMIEAVSRG